MDNIKKLVACSRSYRSFDESSPIGEDVMRELVAIARQCPSGMNRQPLRYRILKEEKDIETMLKNCRFATRLSVKLPPEGQKPTGFILIFSDRETAASPSLTLKDVGIAAQTILLAATERGFGGCMLGSFDPKRLLSDFSIPERYEPQLVIALGKPAELSLIVEAKNGDLGYYRDAPDVHIVPKLPLDELFI